MVGEIIAIRIDNKTFANSHHKKTFNLVGFFDQRKTSDGLTNPTINAIKSTSISNERKISILSFVYPALTALQVLPFNEAVWFLTLHPTVSAMGSGGLRATFRSKNAKVSEGIRSSKHELQPPLPIGIVVCRILFYFCYSFYFIII